MSPEQRQKRHLVYAELAFEIMELIERGRDNLPQEFLDEVHELAMEAYEEEDRILEGR